MILLRPPRATLLSASAESDLSNRQISYCNHKQLFKRLNMLNLSYDDIKKILQQQ
ncbi:MAG: DUF4093 domain-containing protein [Malacoplasma sp.]|nr:DUF4093 domain-containing protein [Malacoplasma sp.]